MNLVTLRANRAVWRRREVFRWRRWSYFQHDSHRPRDERLKLVAKWFDLYSQAHNRRVWYDRQIALKKLGNVATRISTRGVNLIKGFEGFSGRPYQDSVGVWTIGYGHIEGVGPGSKWLTEAQASQLLADDLNRKYVPYVTALHLPLNQNQLDALVSFVYNVGSGGVGANTSVGRNLRAHNWVAAADALLAWDHAGGQVLEGLARRRREERALFLSK